MAHFTLKVRSPTGSPIFESDFTTHQLIPLVRQVMRMLDARPYLASALVGYRAIITPRYEDQVTLAEFIKPDPEHQPADALVPTIQIVESDLDTDMLATFEPEVQAFYNPGSSLLCTHCPERNRCPGSGQARHDMINSWIILNPAGMRTNEPMRAFTLRIESQSGERLYERTFSSGVFQPFIDRVSERLVAEGRMAPPVQAPYRARIIVRYDQQLYIEPLVAQIGGVAAVHATATTHALIDEPPPLVDWDTVEAEQTDELEITLLGIEKIELQRKPMPMDRCKPVGAPAAGDLHIFADRLVFERLRSTIKDSDHEIGGVLVGQAFQPPNGDQPYIEITGIIPTTDALGTTSLTLDSHLWRQVEAQLADTFPGQRTIGWYQSHLLGPKRIAVYTGGHLIQAGAGERLFLSKDEFFMHKSFFQEAWHVALVIDAIDDRYRFYQWRGEAIVECPGYFVID